MEDERQDTGASANAEIGSREPRPSGRGPTGFDPARVKRELLVAGLEARATWPDEALDPNTVRALFGAAAETIRALSGRDYARNSFWRGYGAALDAMTHAFRLSGDTAIATEARRAETPKSGSVHEGASRKASPSRTQKDSGNG